MLLETILALSLPFLHRHEAAGSQLLAGPEFEAAVQDVGRRCSVVEPRLRKASAAGLVDIEDAFRGQLSGPARARLDEKMPRARDGALSGCAGHEQAACAATAYLSAFRETKLNGAFVLYLCGHAQRLR